MTSGQPYRDRREAGLILAAQIRDHIHATDSVVLALPCGGVPIGFEVARELDAPLDVLCVRKLGAPGHPELALGAIASGGSEVLNDTAVRDLGISPFQIAALADREVAELHRRDTLYRGDRPPVDLRGRTAILVDEGLGTGFPLRAAIRAARDQGARRLVVAVPVGDRQVCEQLARFVDNIVCPLQPDPLFAEELWYQSFPETTDGQVHEFLAAAHANVPVGPGWSAHPWR